MKQIDTAFAMRMLEKKLGKTETQIRIEAAHETGDWPAGNYELEQSLATQQEIAKEIMGYFGVGRPPNLTREIIEEFLNAHSRRAVSHLTNSEIERQRRTITIVYDIYEE